VITVHDPLGKAIVGQINDVQELRSLILMLAGHEDPKVRGIFHELCIVHDNIAENHNNLIKAIFTQEK